MEGTISNPPSLARLTLMTVAALVVAIIVAVTIVLPAEFGRDPTGVGGLLGLDAIGASGEGAATQPAAQFYAQAYRSDVVEIPIFPKGAGGPSQLEYKVHMKAGETLVYSWEIEGGAGEIYYDMHSETDVTQQVIEFKQATGARSDGSLVAPVDGVHGWYWQNRSTKPLIVRLRTAGFYELIPPGQPGNKLGILPKTPATAAQ
jgi:hypothetical protein